MISVTFKNRGLYFIHLNINSLLSKVDELREIAKVCRAAFIGISESIFDNAVLDGEVNIEGYDVVRSDRKDMGECILHHIRYK